VPPASAVAQAVAAVPADRLEAAVSELDREITRLQKELFRIDKKLLGRRPRGKYIVIDAAHNRLWLRHGEKTLREAICSTGSGKLLEDPAGGRSWIFSTPRGEFHVTNRLENPLWRKPDWAFIEEGEPVPTREDAVERFEEGVLGEYALAFGDGYLIHGTLYTRLLGKSVTHGCVRLGPVDLKAVYDAASLRTKIYVF
jgi:L,D-transpeptidase YbiS